MSRHPHIILSVAMGGGPQPTTIAALEQIVIRNDDHWKLETGALRLRHLERVPLEENYIRTVERITTLLEAPDIKDGEKCGGPTVVLDITASGKALLELFERVEIEPIAVSITGVGTTEDEVDTREWQVPRVELIGLFRVLFETGRLKLAKDLDLVSTLLDELHAFKMKPPRIDPGDPDSWRETDHDGLVIATALACWRASRNIPTPQVDRDRCAEAEKNRPRGDVWAG